MEKINKIKNDIITHLNNFSLLDRTLKYSSALPCINKLTPYTIEFVATYDLSDVGYMVDNILYKQDKIFISILDEVTKNSEQIVKSCHFDIWFLESIRKMVELHRKMADKYIINSEMTSALLGITSSKVDFETRREELLKGNIGSVLNTDIIVSRCKDPIPQNTIYCVPNKDSIGEFYRSIDVNCTNDSNKIVVATMLSIFIYDSKFVSKGIIF